MFQIDMRFKVLLTLLLAVYDLIGSNVDYEIIAVNSVFFYGAIYKPNDYPQIFSGMLKNKDESVPLETSDAEACLLSLYAKSYFTREGEFFYADAYDIIFPKSQNSRKENFDLATKFCYEGSYQIGSCETEIRIDFLDGDFIVLNFYRAKGFVVSLPLNEYKNFSTSNDINIDNLGCIDSILVPLWFLEYDKCASPFVI